ncbi:hypothetical protein FB567DRAFT_206842 [Paraphoma chrysanthemicola]|uniref:Fungal N-terminal domain-containing protein n=1 Tax=Paraphoma chrysanthemicola TaxID=798071 RepID=A0A8K0QWC9_9PLEO|nr:hypothetical protein FB567DRAFT_206842 [Paraphoma chrysanthemicola]
MPIGFGFSVGDFIAGINLLKKAFEALSNTRGATADYTALRETIDDLEKTLCAAIKYESPQHQAAVEEQVSKCTICIKTFLSDFAKFELLHRKTSDPSKVKFVFRKLQWSLSKREDIRKFKEHLDAHVKALQLQLAVFQISVQFDSLKMVQETHSAIHNLAQQVATGSKVQDDLAKDTRIAQDKHFCAMSTMGTLLETGNRSVAVIPDQLNEIQKCLQDGLSPEQQRTMFCLLKESFANQEEMKRQLEDVLKQNKNLEVHLIEVKTMVQMQEELPPQVLLRRPVVLIDAFEGNRLPFHLEFINCFEALFSVLSIRFNDKGDAATQKIQQQMFVLYEHSKQKQINTAGPWLKAFKVSIPTPRDTHPRLIKYRIISRDRLST